MSDGTKTRKRAKNVAGPARSRLLNIASEQSGYFTAEQAAQAGYSRSLLAYHAKTGGFIRVRRGQYRFAEYPPSPREHVLAAWLAVGKDNAVVSHESALEILELSDIIPDAVHITVPRTRRNLPSIPGVKIHTSSRPLTHDDKMVREGIKITSATRSILDTAESGASPEHTIAAVIAAVRRGLTTSERLKRGAEERGKRVLELVSQGLAEVPA
jgi:predicted transcriptional regulator of viral defense system